MSSHHRPILRVVVPFFAITVALGLSSNGVYHDDDLTHYLMARWSAWYPSYLLHIWGRPGLTVPLAAVSWIGDRETGWHAARMLSAVVSAASAWLAAHVARRFDVRPPWLVAALCYLQPLFFVLGYTTLTENFAALYLIGAVALLQSGRLLPASAVFSLVLVTRHESAVFLPIWWIALLAKPSTGLKRFGAVALSIWAPVVHNLAFFAVFGEWPLRIFSQASGSTQYTAQDLLSYVPDALYALTPTIAGLAVIGAAAMIRKRQWLVPVIAVVFFLTQTAVKSLGVYGSGGYGRFMIVVAPLVAILAVAGITDVADRLRNCRPTGIPCALFAAVWVVGWAAVENRRSAGQVPWLAPHLWQLRGVVALFLAILFCQWMLSRFGKGRRFIQFVGVLFAATCMVQIAFIVRPLKLNPVQDVVRTTVNWLDKQGYADAPFFATNPWFAYFLDLAENPRAHKDATLLASLPVGTILVWDSLYSGSDYHRLDAAALDRDPHYELLDVARVKGPSSMTLRVYRKISATPLPTTRDVFYPPVSAGREPVLGIYYVRTRQR